VGGLLILMLLYNTGLYFFVLPQQRSANPSHSQVKVEVATDNISVAAALVKFLKNDPLHDTHGGASFGVLPTSAKPNFLFVLTDDLGWGDLGCFGSESYDTPNIDRLARQGMRFTQAYAAAPVCSPSRASILTGKYPARLHLTDWIPGYKADRAKKLRPPGWTTHLRPEERSLARALASAGYVSASIGKWHLGGPSFWPENHSFAVNVGGCDKGQPPSYFAPYGIPTIQDGQSGEYLTDRLTSEAIRFIESNHDRPFFLYLSHYAVHTPIQAKQGIIEKYSRKLKRNVPQNNAGYAAMIESVDDSVGRITAKLEELNLSNRTVVFFSSDNGALSEISSNRPLRQGKGSPYEGGVRVPLVVRWPGVVPPSGVCNTPVIGVDVYPSMLEMAGLDSETSNPALDGVSLVPELLQAGALKPRSLFWHYPHYHIGGASPYGAVRHDDFKLIEFFESDRVELYNLREDIGEQSDLSKRQPETVRRLREKLARWRTSVNAQMPARQS